MLKVIIQRFNELTEDEQDVASDNGYGKEYAGYIRVTHNEKTILLVNDAMEKEDTMFSRDLSWIPGIIRKAYDLGKSDERMMEIQ